MGYLGGDCGVSVVLVFVSRCLRVLSYCSAICCLCFDVIGFEVVLFRL